LAQSQNLKYSQTVLTRQLLPSIGVAAALAVGCGAGEESGPSSEEYAHAVEEVVGDEFVATAVSSDDPASEFFDTTCSPKDHEAQYDDEVDDEFFCRLTGFASERSDAEIAVVATADELRFQDGTTRALTP
jgi:hypothetical protein